MRRTLKDLVQRCHGDHRPECPILEDLRRGQTDDGHRGRTRRSDDRH